MGRYGRGCSYDASEVISRYARDGKISCRGQKLAANDLGISRGELEKLLEKHNVEKAKMSRGRS
ncbi:hypothetical protein ACFLZB_02320 [Nanoarchaeota archaeon]